MIRHIVMWRVIGNSQAERLTSAQVVKNSFEGSR